MRGFILNCFAVLYASTAWSQPTTDPAKLEQAKRHMTAGAAFYNDPSGHKCEEAYREFTKAYELSGSLNALKAAGVCALELERDGEAIDAFEKVLAGKGSQMDPGEKAQVESDLGALKSAVTWITIQTNRSDVRIVDTRTPSRGFPITNKYIVNGNMIRLGVHPGQHQFIAKVEGDTDLTWNVDIVNGATLSHSFEFGQTSTVVPPVATTTPTTTQPAPPPKETPPTETKSTRPIPPLVYVTGGITAALTIPTVIFMVSASGKKSDYDSQNGTLSEEELTTQQNDVKSANLMADIFLGATLIGAGTTAVLYLTRPEKKTAPKTGVWISPQGTFQSGGLKIEGTF